MKKLLSNLGTWLLMLPLLSGCSIEDAKTRVGALVLIPTLLVIAVLWLLNRRGGEEKWDEQRFPDDEDDDHEDHHLM